MNPQKRLEKMPQGIQTIGLMSHETGADIDGIRIILEEGILSVADQYKRNGKINPGYGSNLQSILGAYNYVSVWDPYCGYGTRDWHNKTAKKVREKIVFELEPCVIDIRGDSDKLKELCNEGAIAFCDSRYGPFSNFRGYTEPTIKVNFNGFMNPKNEDLVRRLNEILEDGMSRKNDKIPSPLILYPTGLSENKPKEINPLNYFASDGKPTFLINPQLKRIATPSSGFGPESFVKNRIKPDDLTGLVIPKDILEEYGEEVRGIYELVKRYEIPLFTSEQNEKQAKGKSLIGLIGSAKMADREDFRFEMVYPK